MIRNSSLTRLTASVRPRHLKLAALFTGGAMAGLFVSVVASYGVVSTLFPRAAAPIAATPSAAAGGLAALSPSGIDALPGQARSSASAAVVASVNVIAEPTEPVVAPLRLAAIDPSTRDLPPAAAEPTEAIEAIAPTLNPAPVIAPAPVVDLTMDRPAVAPPARPVAMAEAFAAVTGGMSDPTMVHPRSRPEGIGAASPAAFAALATGDATGRTSATIGFAAPSLRPTPRPELGAVAPGDAVVLTGPALPATRPAPRPQALAIAMVEPAVMTTSAEIPGIRPQPRPEVLRVASAATSEPRLSAGTGCGRDLARAMPSRPSGAQTGSQFFASLSGAGGSDRDTRIIDELARGNMPGFLHDLHPVRFSGADSRGVATEIVVCVTPDYLALGSDRDFVRVPLGLPAAARIAGTFDMTLPTPRIVDAIFAQAEVRLSPSPMTPGPQMSSTGYFLRHNATIEGQRGGKSGLISGHKKDVVMASRMARAPGRVAIYGWHRASGKPIQPVSTVHGASYADYSHGIRLVSKTAYLNGRAVDLDELLASSRYASLINSDGPLPGPVIRIASR